MKYNPLRYRRTTLSETNSGRRKSKLLTRLLFSFFHLVSARFSCRLAGPRAEEYNISAE
jgi:hypothetical protein